MKTLYENKTIRVLEDADKVRSLWIGDLCQGRAKMTEAGLEPVSPYFKALKPVIANLGGSRALVIGAGACVVPTLMQRKGLRVDVIEPCELMYVLAQDYFNYKRNGIHYQIPGEQFLDEYFEKYDTIFLDAFNKEGRVAELYNVKRYEQMRDMSNKVIINFISKTNIELELHKLIFKDTFVKIKEIEVNNKSPYQSIFIYEKE